MRRHAGRRGGVVRKRRRSSGVRGGPCGMRASWVCWWLRLRSHWPSCLLGANSHCSCQLSTKDKKTISCYVSEILEKKKSKRRTSWVRCLVAIAACVFYSFCIDLFQRVCSISICARPRARRWRTVAHGSRACTHTHTRAQCTHTHTPHPDPLSQIAVKSASVRAHTLHPSPSPSTVWQLCTCACCPCALLAS